MPEQACGHAFVQKRMQHLFAFALLVGHQNFLAGFFLQEDRSGRGLLKILRPDLTSVDQRQRQSVRQNRAEFFHHIQSETRPARPVPMQKAHRGIKADAFNGPAQVRRQQRV